MKTYTFASGTVSPGFVLADSKERGKILPLGEYGPGSFLLRIPLNNNLANQPEVNNNVVQDAFLLNVGNGDKPFFILSRDRSQQNGCCLIRFLTTGSNAVGNGYVSRIIGWKSKELASGHGRVQPVTKPSSIWTDSVWVVHEGELVRVQLAGSQTAFAVCIKNGEPTVEPWVERQLKQQPVEPVKTEPKSVPVSGNSNGGRHGGNPHQTWRALKGSHVVAPSVRIPIKEWTPGLNDMPEPKIELDLDKELAKLGESRVAKFQARYQHPATA